MKKIDSEVVVNVGLTSGQSPPDQEGFCSVRAVARFLGVSPSTIYYWVGRREIPYFKVGRHLRFRISAVVAAIEAENANLAGSNAPVSIANAPIGSLKTKSAIHTKSLEKE